MEKITAIIPTFNEAHNITDAIDSVSFADEIIVVDSFSTDRTVEMATDKGARILHRKYDYPAAQKNWAIPQASHSWIVLIDADERIDDNLKKEILEIVNSGKTNPVAYWIRRRNFFMGKEVKYSGWQGDKVIRLFLRDQCLYGDVKVHEEIVANGNVGIMRNKLIHYTYKDIFHYLEKWDRYTTWSAEERAKRGENPGLFHFLMKPAFRFFRDYFLKLGILDGLTGFLICSLSSMSVFMRSLKVRQLRANQK